MNRIINHRLFGALLALVLVGGMAPAAIAADHVNVSTGATLAGGPLALRGFDPVSYFVDGAPRAGDAAHSVLHDGAVYRFASVANKERFERDPGAYLPAYGGFCAFGVSVGAKFDGDPHVWEIVDDRLYLNLNREIQDQWSSDAAGNIAKADDNWRRIRGTAMADLE